MLVKYKYQFFWKKNKISVSQIFCLGEIFTKIDVESLQDKKLLQNP